MTGWAIFTVTFARKPSRNAVTAKEFHFESSLRSAELGRCRVIIGGRKPDSYDLFVVGTAYLSGSTPRPASQAYT